MIKKLSLIFLLLLAPNASFAEEVQPLKPTISFLSAPEIAPHAQTIARVQSYLSGLSTITSEFKQTAPDGSVSSGKFFMERPSKMRWQYNPPTPILMVANGSELIYYDSELEQISHIPVDSTLIGFLAQEKIRFDNDVGITFFSENANKIRIGVAQKNKPSEGNLVLELSDKPLIIKNMVVTDASGLVTNISLNNAVFGTKIDKKLFDFRDPRKEHHK